MIVPFSCWLVSASVEPHPQRSSSLGTSESVIVTLFPISVKQITHSVNLVVHCTLHLCDCDPSSGQKHCTLQMRSVADALSRLGANALSLNGSPLVIDFKAMAAAQLTDPELACLQSSTTSSLSLQAVPLAMSDATIIWFLSGQTSFTTLISMADVTPFPWTASSLRTMSHRSQPHMNHHLLSSLLLLHRPQLIILPHLPHPYSLFHRFTGHNQIRTTGTLANTSH